MESMNLLFANREATTTFHFDHEVLDCVSITVNSFQFVEILQATKDKPIYVSTSTPCTVYKIIGDKVYLNMGGDTWHKTYVTTESMNCIDLDNDTNDICIPVFFE